METKNRLAAAHAAIAKTGKHPRQIGLENLVTLLLWIFQWGFTSPALVLDLFSRSGGAYADKFVQKGLLVATPTESAYAKRYYTLTKAGYEEALRHAEVLCRYPEINRYRVNQLQLRHDLIAQKLTLDALRNATISGYRTERMISPDWAAHMAECDAKIVDVTWWLGDVGSVGVEVELIGKFGQALDRSIFRVIQTLDEDAHPFLHFYDGIRYFSDSLATLERYQAAMAPGAPLPLWKKDKSGRWREVGKMKVPDWLITKVSFWLIDSRGRIISTLTPKTSRGG